ncbi:hypothetical protein Y032_0974g3260 [Ancylostoma ceylanicum]|uniref:Uncharacterized protein n=1 Tax=Ancylostoma ceylanicum TaxID=53326 RepID=A0A016W870_9BILA|nr:hypothetical protein Y032_0974g3260 [Ancylostoma ceylanicum]
MRQKEAGDVPVIGPRERPITDTLPALFRLMMAHTPSRVTHMNVTTRAINKHGVAEFSEKEECNAFKQVHFSCLHLTPSAHFT